MQSDPHFPIIAIHWGQNKLFCLLLFKFDMVDCMCRPCCPFPTIYSNYIPIWYQGTPEAFPFMSLSIRSAGLPTVFQLLESTSQGPKLTGEWWSFLIGGLEHGFYWNPNSWDDDPIWRTKIFFRGVVEITNQIYSEYSPSNFDINVWPVSFASTDCSII